LKATIAPLRAGLLALAASLLLLAAACKDDEDGGGDTASVEEIVQKLIQTDTNDQAQVDFFFAHTTDSALEDFFGLSREACQAAAAECIGDPIGVERLEDTEIEGEAASTAIWTEDGEAFTAHLVMEDGTWKLNTVAFGPKKLPEGVTPVELSIDEYSFEFDESKITDGNIGFPFTNQGEQAHEIAIARINDEFDLEALAEHIAANPQGLGGLPPGVEDFPVAGFAPPGTSGNLVLRRPLDPGRYLMACFISGEEGTAHALLGMNKEFTVPE
jgi:hypothetical protein